MKNYNFWKFIAIGGLAVNTVIIAVIAFQAFRPHPGPIPPIHPPNKGMGQHSSRASRLINELGFDKKQGQELKKLIRDDQSKVRQLFRSKHQLRMQLFEEESKAKQEELLDAIASKSRKIEAARIEHFIRIEKLCSDEQKRTFKQIKSKLFQGIGPRNARGSFPDRKHRGPRHMPPH